MQQPSVIIQELHDDELRVMQFMTLIIHLTETRPTLNEANH